MTTNTVVLQQEILDILDKYRKTKFGDLSRRTVLEYIVKEWATNQEIQK